MMHTHTHLLTLIIKHEVTNSVYVFIVFSEKYSNLSFIQIFSYYMTSIKYSQGLSSACWKLARLAETPGGT